MKIFRISPGKHILRILFSETFLMSTHNMRFHGKNKKTVNTDNSFYTDTRYSGKIRYNDNLIVTELPLKR